MLEVKIMNKKYYPEYKEWVYEETLPNGLKVLLLPKEDYSSSFAYFTTKFGGSYYGMEIENKTLISGLAHFLEHRLFDYPKGNVMNLYDALGYIFNHSKEIVLCVLDRNLGPTNEHEKESVKNLCKENGMSITDDYLKKIFPDSENLYRQGDILVEALFRKRHSDFLENIYYLSAYSNDTTDRLGEFILTYLPKNHYIEKDDEKRIEELKDYFEKNYKLMNIEEIRRDFPGILTIIENSDLINFVDTVITNFKEKKEQNEVYFEKWREIIEYLCIYLGTKIQKNFNTTRETIMHYTHVKNKNNDYKYLRTAFDCLNVAYTICCDFCHNNKTTYEKQKKSCVKKLGKKHFQNLVYDSMKVFFAWFEWYQSVNKQRG